MYDPTPPPLGDVTRRWTQLTDTQRDGHALRLLGRCPGDGRLHVDQPARDAGACYQRLLPAAVAGEPAAVGWLATSHRPLLVAHGRALLEVDPSEWGAVCLEVLHTTLAQADLSAGRWLRRRVANQLASRLSRAVAHHLTRRRRERPTAPAVLHATHRPRGGDGWDGQLDLSVALERALGRLDAPTRDALHALADDQPLTAIADRHGLSHAAVRQRVTRARRRLQPQLAAYHRSVR